MPLCVFLPSGLVSPGWFTSVRSHASIALPARLAQGQEDNAERRLMLPPVLHFVYCLAKNQVHSIGQVRSTSRVPRLRKRNVWLFTFSLAQQSSLLSWRYLTSLHLPKRTIAIARGQAFTLYVPQFHSLSLATNSIITTLSVRLYIFDSANHKQLLAFVRARIKF